MMLKRLALPSLACLLALTCIAASADRTNTGQRFVFTLDGNSVGFVKSIDGGDIWADVVSEGAAANGATPKHLGQIHYDDVAVQLAPMENKPVQELIQSLLVGQSQPHSASVIDANFDYNVESELQLTNALLSEFSIPALDGSSKDAGYFTLKFSPQSARLLKGSGKNAADYMGNSKSKQWLTSNFRISIGNLPCSRVARIEPLTVKLAGVSTGNGGGGGGSVVRSGEVKQGGGAALELPMIRMTISNADAPAWQAWFDDFVVKGNQQELFGSLSLLAPNMKDELLTFNLYNIGIARLADSTREANSEKIPRIAVDLYFERMELAGVKGAPAAQPSQNKPADTTASASDPKSQAAPAASQPAATGPATPTRIPRSLPLERPLAGASETDTYVIRPNPKIAKDVGRIVIRFPDGTQRRDNQRVQFPADKEHARSATVEWGSVAHESAPGSYLVAVNGKLIENVKVEAGADTMLRLGVLRLNLPDAQAWEIIEEDLDSAPAMFYSSGPGDLGLPIGSYFVRTKSNITPIKIEENKFTPFPTTQPETRK